jgi:hypothetical protein
MSSTLLVIEASTFDLMTGQSIFSFAEFRADVTVIAFEIGEVFRLEMEPRDGEIEAGLGT